MVTRRLAVGLAVLSIAACAPKLATPRSTNSQIVVSHDAGPVERFAAFVRTSDPPRQGLVYVLWSDAGLLCFVDRRIWTEIEDGHAFTCDWRRRRGTND
ncbi:MAG TPA: hypothetical protein VGJ83_04550 [Gemmatimonadales bacterium]|jgi:hypothetical protein